ncbi:MAG: DUF547 domain-containing protein [Candidatus Heimdallarchaeota archaeon]
MLSSKEAKVSNLVLLKWIDTDGNVDYNLLENDKWFWEQIFAIENANLTKYSHEEKFAFWLNAYNFLTVKGVLIELKKNPNWKGNISSLTKLRFFILRKFTVAGKKKNLNFIEQRILRKKFGDPRIHFAINCGSASCPYLPNQLFVAETLERTLDKLTSFFINSGNVRVSDDGTAVFLSKIFKWYKRDFEKAGGLCNFINYYWKKESLDFSNLDIKFDDYDWQLNSQV